MSEAIDVTTGAAEPAGSSGPISNDALVDDALSAILADEGDGEPAPAKSKQAPAQRGGARAPRKEDGDEDPDEDDDAEAAEEDEPSPSDEEEEPHEEDSDSEGDDSDSDNTWGTRDNPIRVKDLPEDRFIKIKVDGEEQVLSLREAMQSGIRERTFYQHLGRLRASERQAQDIAQRAVEWQERKAEELRRALTDPEELLRYFDSSDELEQAFHQAAMAYAKRYAAEQKDPSLKLQRMRARMEAQARAKEEALEGQRRQWLQQQRMAEFQKQLHPGWVAGLKEIGLAKPTPELQRMVKAILSTVSGRLVTAEDVRDAVVKAGRALGVKPPSKEATKPKPATVRPKPREERGEGQRKPGGPKPRRGSIDAILFGVKPPKF